VLFKERSSPQTDAASMGIKVLMQQISDDAPFVTRIGDTLSERFWLFFLKRGS
jgi:hypothetical protein